MRRGMGTLFLIGLVAFLFIVANIILYFLITVFAGDTENMYYLSIEINERGKELKCFFLAEKDGYYMETLGNLAADGGSAGFEGSKQDMIEILQEMDKKCMIVYKGMDSENPIASLGTCPKEESGHQAADIPVPGGGEGEVKMTVRII